MHFQLQELCSMEVVRSCSDSILVLYTPYHKNWRSNCWTKYEEQLHAKRNGRSFGSSTEFCSCIILVHLHLFHAVSCLCLIYPCGPCNRPHHSGPGYDCRGRMVHWAGACAGALGNKWKQARCDKLCIPGSCIRLHLLLQLIWVRFRTGFPCRCGHDKKAWIIEATMQATNHTSITWRVFWDASLSTGLLPSHGI